jgi:hypothetical protein
MTIRSRIIIKQQAMPSLELMAEVAAQNHDESGHEGLLSTCRNTLCREAAQVLRRE